MEDIRLRIVFETEPSLAVQRELKARAEIFLRDAAPEVQLEMMQGTGSWWFDLIAKAVSVGKWLAPIAGAWVVKKVLDHASNMLPSRGEQEEPKSVTQLLDKEKKLLAPQGFAQVAEQAYIDEWKRSLESTLPRMNDLSDACQQIHPSPEITISFSRWSEVERIGVAYLFSKNSSGHSTFQVHVSDSREDLNSRLPH